MRQRDGVKGAIYGAIYGEIIHMERDGDGENLNFAGMVGRMAAGMVGVVRWCGCGGGVGGVPGLQPYKMQGCKVASIATIKAYLCTSFIVV